MKATVSNIKSLAKSLKQDFKNGKQTGSYSATLERIVLGYENAFRSGDGHVGIEIRGGNFKYLYLDIQV